MPYVVAAPKMFQMYNNIILCILESKKDVLYDWLWFFNVSILFYPNDI